MKRCKKPQNGNGKPPLQGGLGAHRCGDLIPIVEPIDRKSAKLEQQAVRSSWPEPDQRVKEEIVKTQSRLAIDPNGKPREKIAATQTLLKIERANQPETPLVAIQNNVGTLDDMRAVDRKRLAEAELAELRLSEQRKELVHASVVRQSFDTISANIRKKLEAIRKISPDSAELIVDALSQAQEEIDQIADK